MKSGEAAAVCDDDQLHTIACAKLGQGAADVGLDRGLGAQPLRYPISSDVISLTSDEGLSIGTRSVKATVEEMVAMSLLMWILAARCGTSRSLTMGEDGLREIAWSDRLDRLSPSTVAGGPPPQPAGC